MVVVNYCCRRPPRGGHCIINQSILPGSIWDARSTNTGTDSAWALNPHVYLHQEGFVVESAGGRTFRNCDLSEKDWMDVDEETGESASIMDLEWKFEVLKVKK